MRYWFDTEFMEDGPYRPVTLLSIGIVAEDGREFYGTNIGADHSEANPWVRKNVLPFLGQVLDGGPIPLNGNLTALRESILDFIGDDPEPEFWAYYADYDWVVLCQLFGAMIDLPKSWPKFCMDIKQWCVQLGNPRLPKDPENEHHALADARWNVKAWEFLAQYEEDPRPPYEDERRRAEG